VPNEGFLLTGLQQKPRVLGGFHSVTTGRDRRGSRLELTTAVDVLSGLAVIGGIAFAVIQLRQYQQSRRRELSLELLRAFQTPDFAKALRFVYGIPEGLSKAEIEEHAGDDMHLVYALMTTWESLGILVFRRELPLVLVEDFFSGPITISWRKLRTYVEDEREEQGRETIEEWFEWLADRLREREHAEAPVPAHVEHARWQPPRGS